MKTITLVRLRAIRVRVASYGLIPRNSAGLRVASVFHQAGGPARPRREVIVWGDLLGVGASRVESCEDHRGFFACRLQRRPGCVGAVVAIVKQASGSAILTAWNKQVAVPFLLRWTAGYSLSL